MENMKKSEEAVIEEIFAYFREKQALVESERIDIIHDVLDRNKQRNQQAVADEEKGDGK
jgi:hypothetical protein